MAAEALRTAAATLGAARHPLRHIASTVPGIPDSHSPDAFFQTIAAAGPNPLLFSHQEVSLCAREV